MSKPLVVHDDSIVSRIAYMIEQRRRSIIELETHLSGILTNLAWANAKREDLEKELEYQRQCLVDLYESLKGAPVQIEIANNIVRYGYGRSDN